METEQIKRLSTTETELFWAWPYSMHCNPMLIAVQKLSEMHVERLRRAINGLETVELREAKQ